MNNRDTTPMSPKEDPTTPLKYGRATAPHDNKMPVTPNIDGEIPFETRIWLSVFDGEPAGPYRPDEQRFQN